MRKDLDISQIVVQSSHAVIELFRNFNINTEEHPHLVICSVKNEEKLWKAYNEIRKNIVTIQWIEPDMDYSLTAIATVPVSGEKRKELRKYQLLNLNALNLPIGQEKLGSLTSL